jgi:putative transposase
MARRGGTGHSTIRGLLSDVVTLIRLALTPRARLAVENLFLRKQLALYHERQRQAETGGPCDASRPRASLTARGLALDPHSRQARQLIRSHRQGWRLVWRWKSRPGRPPIPKDVQRLIVRMPHENPTWGEERIPNELCLKLGLRVSPRTVGRYLRAAAAAARWVTVPAVGDVCPEPCARDRRL